MTAPSAVAGCLLLLVFAGAAPPAAVAAGEIGLSNDGVTWSASLPQPLFDAAFRWVPGDDESSSFFVRNQGRSGAQLTIAARSTDTDRLLANNDIDLLARAAGGPWIELRNGKPSQSLMDQAVARGGIVRIDVRAVFDPASTNQSQSKAVPLSFVVRLTDKAASDGSDGNGGGGRRNHDDDDQRRDRNGILPGTGSTVDPWDLWIAAILIGGGLALIWRSQDEDAADV